MQLARLQSIHSSSFTLQSQIAQLASQKYKKTIQIKISKRDKF